MRIAFLHSAREMSGTARAFMAAARGLAPRGHSVTMLVVPDSAVDNYMSRSLTTLDTPAIPTTPGNIGIGAKALLNVVPYTTKGNWFGAALRLRRILRQNNVEVIFVCTNREHFIASMARALGSHAQVVRRIPTGLHLTLNLTGKIAIRLAPTVFFFSSDSDEHSVPLPKRALGSVVASLGVDINCYPQKNGNSPTDEPYIICVYDQNAHRRAATAVRTLSMLAPRHHGLRLKIVGPGSDNDDLRMQAAALNILHLVDFLGERDDQQKLMQEARLGWVVADSDSAGFGVLDLMALGIPVLAGDDTVAQRYVAHHITGALLPSDDESLTAATVAGLISSEEQCATMGEAGRARVAREFPEERMIDGFERAARYAVDKTARGGRR